MIVVANPFAAWFCNFYICQSNHHTIHAKRDYSRQRKVGSLKAVCIYSLRHRKCGVRGCNHELKTRTGEVRASEGF